MNASADDPSLRWQQRSPFLIGISAAAGWLDALAFLYLGKVFLSFMSGNLLFLGLGAGQWDGGLLARAGIAIGVFFVAAAVGGRLTGSEVSADDPRSPMTRTLWFEAALLVLFAILWLVAGTPVEDSAVSFVLIAIGAGAMGLQAAVSLAFHLHNVATVAMTATLAQLAALIGWRRREGSPIVARTPAVSLMLPLLLAYLIAAVIVAVVPETGVMAFGPVVLIVGSLAIDAGAAGRVRRGRTPAVADVG